MEDTALTTLLKEGFPGWRQLPTGCWIFLAVDEVLDTFIDLIGAVTKGGGRPALVERLRVQHPTALDHAKQHDKRLLDVFTEGAAFAWAHEVARLEKPNFVAAPGSPDILAGDVWIEAKSIRHSQQEEQLSDDVIGPLLDSDAFVMRGPVTLTAAPAGLVRKLQAGLDDAVRKWERQGRTGRLVVFYCWRLDFGISPRRASSELHAWADRAAKRSGVRIVICDVERWQSPSYEAP